jgi:putative transposase
MKNEYEIHGIDIIEGEYRMIVNYEDATIKCKFCNSTELVKNGHRKGTQYWICKECGKGFVANKALPKMKYPIDIVSSAVYDYYAGNSLHKITRGIEQKTGILPSTSSIYEWVNRLTNISKNEAKKYTPKVGDTWIADETFIRMDKHKNESSKVENPYDNSRSAKWIVFWDIIDADTRFLLASFATTTRSTQDAQKLMELASNRAGKVPKVVVTDKLASYLDGVELAFGADTTHKQGSPFELKNNNNLIERFHGTIKERTKVMRAFRNKDTLQKFMDGWLINYNYFRPHMSLKDKTPAEKAGIKFPFHNWLEVSKSESPTNNPDKKLSEIIKINNLDIQHFKPYRKRKIVKSKRKSKAENMIVKGIR